MHVARRTPLALLVVLLHGAPVLMLACDSGTPEAGGKAAVNADAKVEAKVQIDTRAVADAAAKASVEADAAARAAVDAAANAAVVAAAPALKAAADVEAALGGKLVLRAADLDLKGVVDLVATGQVRSAAELELLLNAPGAAAHRIDVDADGKLDYLQVVEVRADGAVNFELRAIPSSKLDVSLAVLVATLSTVRAEAEGAVKVAANYAAAVEGGADFNVAHDLKADFSSGAVVLADASAGAFAGWAFDASRTPHVSLHLAPADIEVGADGAAAFVGDVSASLDAARLAALRAALKVELLAAVDPPQVAVKTGAKAKGGASVDHAAKAGSSVKVDSSGGVKVGGSSGVKVGGSGGGISVGGSAGVSVGGGGGISVGGGGKGKAGAGIKVGQ